MLVPEKLLQRFALTLVLGHLRRVGSHGCPPLIREQQVVPQRFVFCQAPPIAAHRFLGQFEEPEGTDSDTKHKTCLDTGLALKTRPL